MKYECNISVLCCLKIQWWLFKYNVALGLCLVLKVYCAQDVHKAWGQYCTIRKKIFAQAVNICSGVLHIVKLFVLTSFPHIPSLPPVMLLWKKRTIFLKWFCDLGKLSLVLFSLFNVHFFHFPRTNSPPPPLAFFFFFLPEQSFSQGLLKRKIILYIKSQ